jgi:hypothetical protein
MPALAIAPLPEQAMGRKRPRRSPRSFCWLSVLATVEIQLVLRCLDVRSRLIAARCNKQLFAAASHPFAWPQEQMATLRAEHDVAAMQSLGARVRGSLLRLSSIRLFVVLPAAISGPLCSELFAVPNVQSIKVQSASLSELIGSGFLLPVLLHPAAHQLRSLDISGFEDYECSSAEYEQLAALPHLHSLSLGDAAIDAGRSPLSPPSPFFPSLTHLSLIPSGRGQEELFLSLSHCPRMTSLQLASVLIRTDLVNHLAQLPLLQQLQLWGSVAKEQTTSAWSTLRLLHEMHLDYVIDANRLLSVLSSAPALHLLRWRCRAPRVLPSSSNLHAVLPQLEPLRQLLTAAPLLQVELHVPSTFDEWHNYAADPMESVDGALMFHGRRCWEELHQLPNELSRVRIVTVDPDEDD